MKPLYKRGDVVIVIGDNDVENELNKIKGDEAVVENICWTEDPLEYHYVLAHKDDKDYDPFWFASADEIKPTGKWVDLGESDTGCSVKVVYDEEAGTTEITEVNIKDNEDNA